MSNNSVTGNSRICKSNAGEGNSLGSTNIEITGNHGEDAKTENASDDEEVLYGAIISHSSTLLNKLR